jgi:GWxTD domain-containing protein
MIKEKFIILIILILSVQISSLFSQDDKLYMSSEKDFFYIDPLVFYGKDSTRGRLDLYIEIPLSNLNFSKNQNTGYFEAYVDYTVVIRNSLKEVVVNNTYSESVKSTKEQLKNITENSEFIIKNYLLSPDKYIINFTLRDKNTTKEISKEDTITVRESKNKEIVFSDLMIVSEYKENEKGKKVITPLVNNNIGNLKEFYIFFEIFYRNEIPTSTEFNYKIKDSKDNILADGNFNYLLQQGENKKIEKLPAGDLVVGEYKLIITNKKSGEVVSQKHFIFRWLDMPISIKDLDLAISQLTYIAKPSELEEIKSAKTILEKEQKFIKFWKSKDPTPGTPRNEVMIEYYNRIRVANERFTHYYVDGWKTDMGMVYIIYGEPSNIEKSQFGASTKPYEIWEYYDIRQKFIFVDDTGFGDYRLTTPIYDREATRLKY